MSARAFEQWLASLTALFDFWTGNHGHKSSSRRCAVKIVRETNDACEPFNCSTCSLVRPLRKRGGDNFSSTAVRFRFQPRHRRASRKKKKKKRSPFVDCYGSDYHVTWTYFSTRNAWWLCAAISEIAPVTIKIVGTMVNLLEISRSD